jgi:hypothetical protein
MSDNLGRVYQETLTRGLILPSIPEAIDSLLVMPYTLMFGDDIVGKTDRRLESLKLESSLESYKSYNGFAFQKNSGMLGCQCMILRYLSLQFNFINL